MSKKQFEQCTLEEATHVEVNGKVYLLGGNEVLLEPYHGKFIGIRWLEEDAFIPEQLFHILGIKTFKEKKREPIEFEATFAKYDGNWYQLHTLDHEASYLHNKKAKFKCVEILEKKK
jgi:hypothetical protein